MKNSQGKIRFNYRVYFEDNVKFKMEKYKMPRWWAILLSVFHVFRFWFRWNLGGRYWKPLMLEGRPRWIKHDDTTKNK